MDNRGWGATASVKKKTRSSHLRATCISYAGGWTPTQVAPPPPPPAHDSNPSIDTKFAEILQKCANLWPMLYWLKPNPYVQSAAHPCIDTFWKEYHYPPPPMGGGGGLPDFPPSRPSCSDHRTLFSVAPIPGTWLVSFRGKDVILLYFSSIPINIFALALSSAAVSYSNKFCKMFFFQLLKCIILVLSLFLIFKLQY